MRNHLQQLQRHPVELMRNHTEDQRQVAFSSLVLRHASLYGAASCRGSKGSWCLEFLPPSYVIAAMKLKDAYSLEEKL